MHLVFDVPPSWRSEREGDWIRLASSDGKVVVTATPLQSPELDPRTVFEANLTVAAVYVSASEQQTRTGWPMTVAMMSAGAACRVCVTYSMLTFSAAVVACGSEDALIEHAQTLRSLFASARPHLWSSRPASVAEMFEMEAR